MNPQIDITCLDAKNDRNYRSKEHMFIGAWIRWCWNLSVYGGPGVVYSLYLKHFSQDWEYRLLPSQAKELIELFSKNELAKILSIDREYVPFFYPQCNASFCRVHWPLDGIR